VTFETVERAAARDDQATIDFEGKVDGVPFDGGAGNDFKLVLGSGRTIPGFEDGIIGHKAGESFDVQVTFPADYQETKLAGKNAVFHITLKAVEGPKLPEVNEEFFKLFDIQEGGETAFRQQVVDSMERIVKQIQRTQAKDQIFEQLLRMHEFLLPVSMVEDEAHRLLHAKDEQGGSHDHHHTLESHGPIDPSITQNAQERVKSGLIGRKLIAQYNIRVTHSDIETQVDDLVKQYSYPEMMKKYLLQNENVLRDLEGRALEEKILDVIIEQAKVSDEATTYEELVKQGK
jgi:trigger factor